MAQRQKITKRRFTQIIKRYFSGREIEILWKSRPASFSESKLRKTAKRLAPFITIVE